MASSSRSQSSGLGLMFIGALFILVGGIPGFLDLRMCVNVLRARGWGETQARILSVGLVQDETCQATCTYSYTWAGRTYQGQRVGFSTGGDNIGSWQRNTYDRLSRVSSRRETVPCFVNPRQPSEAVLDRNVRFWHAVIGLAISACFVSVGVHIASQGLETYRRRGGRRTQADPAAGDAEPWRSNPLWSTGVIQPTLASRATVSVIIAVIWGFFSACVLIFLPAQIARERDLLALMSLLLPLVGVVLIVLAVRAVIRKHKFRGSCLQLRTLPGVVGGHLTGDLVIGGQYVGLGQIEITLRCLNTVVRDRGGEARTETNTLWMDTRTAAPPAATFGESQVRVPVDFQIPGSCRPCDDSDSKDSVLWRLNVKAPTDGVDLALEFEVPVFRTSDSNPALGEAPEKLAADEQTIDSSASPVPGKIRILSDPAGGMTFVNSAFPSLAFFSLMFVVACAMTGVAVYAAIQVYKHHWFMLLFLFGFGLVSLLMSILLLSCFGSYRLTLGAGELRVQRRWGPLRWGSTFSHGVLENVAYEQSASGGERKWYRVYAQVSGGRKITLAGMVPGEAAAKWYVHQVLQRTTAGQPAPVVG